MNINDSIGNWFYLIEYLYPYNSAHPKPCSPKKWNYFFPPQAVPAGQIKSFAIPQQKETIN